MKKASANISVSCASWSMRRRNAETGACGMRKPGLSCRGIGVGGNLALGNCSSLCGQRCRFRHHIRVDRGIVIDRVHLHGVLGQYFARPRHSRRLVVENSRSGVLDIAAPILSRVFQELSIGIVHFVDAKKLTAVPFPFQFAQMVVIMLVFFSVATVPLICAVGISNVFRAAVYTFLIVFVFWSVHYIAVEIEHPFGEDPNDLPLEGLNHRFNRVLLRLLEHKAWVYCECQRAGVQRLGGIEHSGMCLLSPMTGAP